MRIMPGTSQEAADASPAGRGAPQRGLRRIPLAVRMTVYSVLFLAAVLVAVPWLCHKAGEWLLPRPVEIGWFLRCLGAALFTVCFIVYARSSYWLTRLGRGAYVEFDPPKEFVATGPYRWVRNPIAGSLVMMVLGEALAFSSIGIFLLFILAIPLAHLQVIRIEEPLLRKRFGTSYEQYLASVPRWIPRRPRGDGP
jgi:protein-S-isoprenylcysteine O-methyltransferase Ste14